jgi:3-mercaptopyruvate sulfurtransferase SseA
MRLFISLSAAIMLALVALTACNSSDGSGTKNTSKPQTTTITNNTTPQTPPPAGQTTAPGDGVRRITVAELREAVDKGTAVIIDVRSDDQYKTSHIKGALHIPEAEVAARSGELPRDKTIVTYCS